MKKTKRNVLIISFLLMVIACIGLFYNNILFSTTSAFGDDPYNPLPESSYQVDLNQIGSIGSFSKDGTESYPAYAIINDQWNIEMPLMSFELDFESNVNIKIKEYYTDGSIQEHFGQSTAFTNNSIGYTIVQNETKTHENNVWDYCNNTIKTSCMTEYYCADETCNMNDLEYACSNQGDDYLNYCDVNRYNDDYKEPSTVLNFHFSYDDVAYMEIELETAQGSIRFFLINKPNKEVSNLCNAEYYYTFGLEGLNAKIDTNFGSTMDMGLNSVIQDTSSWDLTYKKYSLFTESGPGNPYNLDSYEGVLLYPDYYNNKPLASVRYVYEIDGNTYYGEPISYEIDIPEEVQPKLMSDLQLTEPYYFEFDLTSRIFGTNLNPTQLVFSDRFSIYDQTVLRYEPVIYKNGIFPTAIANFDVYQGNPEFTLSAENGFDMPVYATHLDDINALLDNLENNVYNLEYRNENNCLMTEGIPADISDSTRFVILKPRGVAHLDEIINPSKIYVDSIAYGAKPSVQFAVNMYDNNLNWKLYNENNELVVEKNQYVNEWTWDEYQQFVFDYDVSSLPEGAYKVIVTESISTSQLSLNGLQTHTKTPELSFTVRYPNSSISIDRSINPTSITGTKKLADAQSSLNWYLYDESNSLLFSDSTTSVPSTVLELLSEQTYKVVFIEKDLVTNETHTSQKEFLVAQPNITIQIDYDLNPNNINGTKKLDDSLSSITWKLKTKEGNVLFSGTSITVSSSILSTLTTGEYTIVYREEIIGYSQFFSEETKDFKIERVNIELPEEQNPENNPKTGSTISKRFMVNLIFILIIVIAFLNIAITLRKNNLKLIDLFRGNKF